MTTDTGMVERIARAVRERSTTAGREPGSHLRSQPLSDAVCVDLVVTVLECLRTPTPEMVEAMQDSVSGFPRMAACSTMFSAAIDRALSPSKGEGE